MPFAPISPRGSPCLTIEVRAGRSSGRTFPSLAQWFVEELNAESARVNSPALRGSSRSFGGLRVAGRRRGVGGGGARRLRASEGPRLTVDSLPARLAYAPTPAITPLSFPRRSTLMTFSAKWNVSLIRRAVATAKGNKTAAARLLGLSRPRLYRRMVQLGLESPADEIVFEETESPPEWTNGTADRRPPPCAPSVGCAKMTGPKVAKVSRRWPPAAADLRTDRNVGRRAKARRSIEVQGFGAANDRNPSLAECRALSTTCRPPNVPSRR